ncbi:MAG: metalloregulator ArsR/SmtB family transcription factor [Bryobacterales bacterium]|nr:metalloregulator ArsR/SmtB family transcription factor [Bryobacterales bacterium]
MEVLLDQALRAVSDPTRREILRMIAAAESSAGEIASRFSITRPAVSQHLSVLLNAGLVKVRPKAQQRLFSLDQSGLEAVFNDMERFWEEVFEPESAGTV